MNACSSAIRGSHDWPPVVVREWPLPLSPKQPSTGEDLKQHMTRYWGWRLNTVLSRVFPGEIPLLALHFGGS
jgi:hypothetical protein